MIDVYLYIMTKILPILTVFLSFILFSPISLGEWKFVSSNESGDDFFVDYDRIRKNNGYVYYWSRNEFKKPLIEKYYSNVLYSMVDCEVLREKHLSSNFYEGHMGKGDSLTVEGDGKWTYPPPGSVLETILKSVCNSI